MPHVYDTGQSLPQRTALRNAIVARLALLARPGLYVRHVGMLPMRVAGDDIGQSEISAALQGQQPAILVGLGRGDASAAGMPATRSRISIEVAVYVVSGHRRGIVEGRLAGDVRSADVTQDPGIETLIEHVEELLAGWDPGITGVEELRLQSEAEIFTLEDVTVWELMFTVRVDRSVLRHPLITVALTEIAAAHHVDGADPANPVVAVTTPIAEAP